MHWPLPTTGVIEFGDSKWSWDPGYPSEDQMQGFSKMKKLTWSGFRYKQNNNISQLCGIGIDFTDGS